MRREKESIIVIMLFATFVWKRKLGRRGIIVGQREGKIEILLVSQTISVVTRGL